MSVLGDHPSPLHIVGGGNLAWITQDRLMMGRLLGKVGEGKGGRAIVRGRQREGAGKGRQGGGEGRKG